MFVSKGTILKRLQNVMEVGILKIVAIVDPIAINNQADAMLGMKVAAFHTQLEVSVRISQFKEVVYVL